jgi:hypothetical protein
MIRAQSDLHEGIVRSRMQIEKAGNQAAYAFNPQRQQRLTGTQGINVAKGEGLQESARGCLAHPAERALASTL